MPAVNREHWEKMREELGYTSDAQLRKVQILVTSLDNAVFELGVKLTNTTWALAIVAIGWVITSLLLLFHLLA